MFHQNTLKINKVCIYHLIYEILIIFSSETSLCIHSKCIDFVVVSFYKSNKHVVIVLFTNLFIVIYWLCLTTVCMVSCATLVQFVFLFLSLS